MMSTFKSKKVWCITKPTTTCKLQMHYLLNSSVQKNKGAPRRYKSKDRCGCCWMHRLSARKCTDIMQNEMKDIIIMKAAQGLMVAIQFSSTFSTGFRKCGKDPRGTQCRKHFSHKILGFPI